MLKETTLKKAVEFAIMTEQLGAQCYSRLAEKFAADEEIHARFKRLAKDEVLHEKQFRTLLQNVPPETRGFQEEFDVLRAWSISEFFSNREGLMQDVEQIETRDDALLRAFNLEKDTLGFYQSLRDILGSDPVLQEIIEAEKEHLRSVMALLMTGAKFRGMADTGPA